MIFKDRKLLRANEDNWKDVVFPTDEIIKDLLAFEADVKDYKDLPIVRPSEALLLGLILCEDLSIIEENVYL